MPFDPALIADVLDAAGLLLLKMRDEFSVHVLHNNIDGPVSTADLAVQQLVSERLQDLTPTIPIVGEEYSAGWEDIVAEAARRDDFLWILDPLDGTSGYLKGIDDYGIQLALIRGSTIVGGWIHCPSFGWKVQAWDGREGVDVHGPARVDMTAPTCLAMVRAVIASGDFDDAHRQRVDDLRPMLARTRGTRSCAVDYVEIILGRQDLLLYRRTLPWDHAPGVYLAQRAGASAQRYDGMPYQIHDRHGGLIVTRCASLRAYQDRFLPPSLLT
jgi:fructose-1,6-bisphosphatase/inositol monophosphatase family enzyme